jgi:endonuclease/exonuclease/phosphatase family metal-dependent hydrolase
MLDWVRGQVVAEHPDVVIGDFNTPRRASGLSPLAPGYVHAYDARGEGWSYTWPVPVPVVAIDQCIVASGVDVSKYRLVSTRASDHRLQEIELSRPAR